MYGYIYKLVNNLNNKIYIGQTVRNPTDRFKAHIHKLEENAHHSRHLQNSYNKYGNVFSFHIINYATSKEVLDELEIKYIAKYKSTNQKYGYNMIIGGSGVRHTPGMKEHKSKLLTANNPMKNPKTVKKVEKTLRAMGHRVGKKNCKFRHDIYDNSYLTFLYWDLLLPSSFISNFFNTTPSTIRNRLKSNGTCLKNKSIQNSKYIYLQSRFIKELQKYPKKKPRFICLDKRRNKWFGNRTINKKSYFLGYHNTEEEALEAVEQFNKKMGIL